MYRESVIQIIIAGLLGTTAMTAVMALIHHFKLANADMIRAIGSLATRSNDNAFWPGVIMHYTAGVFFAFLYAALVGMAPVEGPQVVVLITFVAGVFHGLVVSLFLGIMVAEHHPVERFRKAGTGVVVAHLVGHLFYGLVVGLAFVWMNVRIPRLLGA